MITPTDVHWKDLRPAPWRATYIFKPDLRLLGDSLADHGWIAPLIVRAGDGMIIDGFARWLVVQTDKRITDPMIPVIQADVTEAEAMVMHLRLNRGRGQLVARPMSRILRSIVESGDLSAEDLQALMRMSDDEFDVLLDGSLLKSRKLAEHKYSKAWVPVEAPVGAANTAGPVIERPPNADR